MIPESYIPMLEREVSCSNPPPPPHLNGMVWRAGAGLLHGSVALKGGGMILDVQKYITAWALAYLCRG